MTIATNKCQDWVIKSTNCRNPNFPRNPTNVHSSKRQDKQRLGINFDWDPYDPTYKKYLHIGKQYNNILSILPSHKYE